MRAMMSPQNTIQKILVDSLSRPDIRRVNDSRPFGYRH
jgi:hypothetical protein